MRQAKLNVCRAQEEYSLAQEQIENGVQANYVNFLTSFTDLRTQEKSVELADQNYNVTSNRYKNDLCPVHRYARCQQYETKCRPRSGQCAY